MDVVIGSLIGLVVALIGTFFGHLLNRRSAISRRLHQSRIEVYTEFPAAVMELRRALMNRWRLEHGKSATRDEDVYPVRVKARSAYFAVQLIGQSELVRQRAREALDLVMSIKETDERSVFDQRADGALPAIEAFVDAARDEIAAKFKVG